MSLSRERGAPLDIAVLLGDPSFARALPPLARGSNPVLTFNDDERLDPRLLALIALKDTIQLGELLCCANNAANSASGPLITSAEAAVKRIGVRAAYELLVASAKTPTPEASVFSNQQRHFLQTYSASVCLTARKLATWLRLDETKSAMLALGVLLESTGIYAGLLSTSEVRARFTLGLSDSNFGADLRNRQALDGFCYLSARVADQWGAPLEVGVALTDSALAAPTTEAGLLIATVGALVHAKAVGADQLQILEKAKLAEQGSKHSVGSRTVDLGVFLS